MRRVPVALIVLLACTCTGSGTGAFAGEGPSITPLNQEELHRLIGQSKGSVVLLNFWATWCAPCVEEFPGLLELRQAYGSKGFRLELVSIDDRKKTESVRAFLRRMGVTFDSYIKSARDDEAFINAVDPHWSGAIPAAFIYDAKGQLVHSRIDEQTFDELARLIEPLLPRQGGTQNGSEGHQ
jgi:thiol-disulfide isomerase/thioredoxin